MKNTHTKDNKKVSYRKHIAHQHYSACSRLNEHSYARSGVTNISDC